MALKKKVVSGFMWTAGEKFTSLFIQLSISLIILRFLTPGDFGLIALLTIFSLIGYSIIDSGFSQALIRKQNASDEDYSSIFYLNMGLAIFLYLLLVGLTNPIARLFDEPELAKYIPWVYLALPLSALGLIQTTILTKQMNFKPLSTINLITTISSSAVLLGLAAFDYGPWAIVGQLLTIQIVRTLLLWIVSPWRPKWQFSMASVKEMFGFGSRLFATGLINQLFNNLSIYIIGQLYNPAQVGLYDKSLKLKENVSTSLSNSVQNVTFPALSSFQDNDQKLKLAGRQVVQVLSFILFPVMLGLTAISTEGFTLAGGDKWVPAIPYFNMFCLAAFFIPLSTVGMNILKAKGKGNLILSLELLKKGFALGVILYASTKGVAALVWAYVFWIGFEMAVNSIWVRKIIGYRFREQITDTLPYILLSLVMFYAVMFAGKVFFNNSLIISLIGKTSIGIVLYIVLSWIFKPKGWLETTKIVNELFRQKKRNKVTPIPNEEENQ